MASSRSTLAAITTADLRRRARMESMLDIDTTVVNRDGSTDSASGANPNSEVPSQSAREAGRSVVNPTVKADRGPGVMAPGVKSTSVKESKAPVMERSTTTGLFPGCLVKVVETATHKTVERHVAVTKVQGKTITVRGGEVYSQDKYTFLRIS
jgi:hypothetical protein